MHNLVVKKRFKANNSKYKVKFIQKAPYIGVFLCIYFEENAEFIYKWDGELLLNNIFTINKNFIRIMDNKSA